MIFEQLFDNKSSTYTYVISSGKGREALIIDPQNKTAIKQIKKIASKTKTNTSTKEDANKGF